MARSQKPPKPRKPPKPPLAVNSPPPLPNPLPEPAANGDGSLGQGGAASAMHAGGGQLMRASQLVRRETTWLVAGLIPADELTLVCGDTSAGKTSLYAALMAQVTAGVMFGGGDRRPFGRCVYLGRESDLHGRVLDLMLAARVDLDRVVCADLLSGDREAPSLHLPDRLDKLDRVVAGERASLLVIDPVKSYLSPGVSDIDGQAVRAVLEGLQQLARRNGCTTVATAHFRKSTAGRPSDWIAGSREWSQVPRHLVALGRDPRNPDARLIAVLKAIAGREPPSRTFTLRDSPPAVQFLLGAECGVSASDMGAQLDTEVDRMTRADARTYLKTVLEAGEKSAASLLESAEKAGIKKHTLQRAKIDLGVVSALVGSAGDQYWVWRRPEQWPPE